MFKKLINKFFLNLSKDEEIMADKLLVWEKKYTVLRILENKATLRFYGIVFIIIGIAMVGFMIPWLMGKIFWVYLLLAFPLMFLFSGLFYMYRAQNGRVITIDFNQKIIFYSPKLTIPFKTIKQFKITTVVYFSAYGIKLVRKPSWCLQIEDYNKHRAPLFTCENKFRILEIAELFTLKSGIKTDTKIETV